MPLSSDPVKRERQLANLRPPRVGEGRVRRYRKPHPTVRLPRAPFTMWLEHLVAQNGHEAAALELGVEPRTVHRHRYEAGETIGLKVADRLLTAAHAPHELAILYPLDEPVHDRWCEMCHEVVTTNDDLCCPWCEEATTP